MSYDYVLLGDGMSCDYCVTLRWWHMTMYDLEMVCHVTIV